MASDEVTKRVLYKVIRTYRNEFQRAVDLVAQKDPSLGKAVQSIANGLDLQITNEVVDNLR